ARGIPAKRDPLRLAAPDRLPDPEVLTHIVEDELLTTGAAHRVGERIDVADRALQILWMMPRLVHKLDEQDSGLILERHAGVAVHVIEDLPQVVNLCRERRGVGTHTRLAEVPAEARCRSIR